MLGQRGDISKIITVNEFGSITRIYADKSFYTGRANDQGQPHGQGRIIYSEIKND